MVYGSQIQPPKHAGAGAFYSPAADMQGCILVYARNSRYGARSAMEFLLYLADVVFHLDTHFQWILAACGAWTYVILILIVFAETGLVITPFLPGDSLLFAAGTFAGLGMLNPWILVVTLSLAAMCGDSVNYAVGRRIGPRVFRSETHLLFKREYLDRTRDFYRTHGAKMIVFARFVPIIRTFAPFVAGIGCMPYRQFFLYNVAGGILWVLLFVFGGVLFGNIPAVRGHFTLVILGIIGMSLLPGIVEWWRQRK